MYNILKRYKTLFILVCIFVFLYVSAPYFLLVLSKSACDASLCKMVVHSLDRFYVTNITQRTHNTFDADGCCLDIAHAGGAYNDIAYSNSLEALDANYNKGRRVFEIDFLVTTDNKIVLGHDPFKGDMTAQEYLSVRTETGLTRMGLDDLLLWLDIHKDAQIITDTKNDFEVFFAIFIDSVPKDVVQRNFIFQTYNFDQLDNLNNLQEQYRLILTIYKMRTSDEYLIKHFQHRQYSYALTIPEQRAYRLAKEIVSSNRSATF